MRSVGGKLTLGRRAKQHMILDVFLILLLDTRLFCRRHWWYDWRLPGVPCVFPTDHCGHWGSKGPGLKMIQMCVFQICLVIQTWYITNALEMFVFFCMVIVCRCISVSCRCYARHTLKARRRIWFSFGNYEMWRSSACRPSKLEPVRSRVHNTSKNKVLNSRHWKGESPFFLQSRNVGLTRKALIGYWHTESLIHSALSSVPTVSGPLIFWMCWVRSPL